jgi:hypothetical protein
VGGQINPSLAIVRTRLCCILYIWIIYGAAIILICDQCSKGWHMGCFMPPLEATLLENGFAFNAQNKLENLYN